MEPANSIRPLKNVTRFMDLTGRLMDRPPHLPGFGVFHGMAGLGKTMSAIYAINSCRAHYIECDSTFTRKAFCEAVMVEIGLLLPRQRLTVEIYRAVQEIGAYFADNPDRPLIVDEADFLMKGRKIIEIAKRGIHVTMLFSREANIGNDINYRSLFRICRQADITVHLSGKMIHSKLMLIDDETVILGSANISVFSMQKGAELDVVVRDNPQFIESVKATIDQRIDESTKAQSIAELSQYNRVIASLQQLHQLLQ